MKTTAKRFAQLYLFVFLLISVLVFAVNVKGHQAADALPTALAHGALWPVTLVQWLANEY